ncbi:hypothetical protein BRSU_2411 [Brachyspira suanatina]|uniref:Uncharacterized protein n=1 Tax=Brachyspira suanatina TaxID=381802 RepID=A0A0G4K9M8_9SPIR|nr:DUF2971 domain-containing protein [Brachyspira suanatina]CRF35069.1 hypothetical protein BRSU_2411 [Brachyspira suanatina]
MNDKENIIKEIENLIDERKYKKAIKICNKYLNNNNIEIFFYKAFAIFKLKRYKKAIMYFLEIIKKFSNSQNTKYFYTYLFTALSYLKANKYKLSMKYLKDVINKNKDFSEAYYYIGLIEQHYRNYNEALNNYNLAIKCCKYPYNKLTMYVKKIELLIKSKYDEKEIIDSYNDMKIVINNIKKYGKIKYTFIIFNELSSIYNNISYIINNYDKNKFIEIINDIILVDFNNKIKKYDIKNSTLYHYTKVNKDTLRSILNNTLWCSNTKEFNDPVDPYIRNNKKESSSQLYNYLLEKIKVACLTTHNDNTLMWSHYADKHKGICIEYNIDNIFNINFTILQKINYHKNMSKSNIFYDDNVILGNNKSIDNITDIFTVKSKEWKYEDEYRILFYDEENKNPNGTLINLPIKSICFGVKTSDDDKELIYNIVNSINEKRLDYNNDIVKLYQAELDDNELFKINIKPYKHEKIK